MSHLGAGISSAGATALAVQAQKAQIANLEAQTAKTQAEGVQTNILTKLGAQKWSVAESQARVDQLSGQYRLSGAQSTQIEQLIRFAEEMQPDRVGLLRADRGVRELELKQSPKKFAADLANLLASADLNLSNAEQARLVTALRALDLNKAINLSKAEESGFMRKVNPYLPAASQVLQMIKSILSTGRN